MKELFKCWWFFFVKILKRKHEEELQLVCLQKEIFSEHFQMFLPKDRSFTCFQEPSTLLFVILEAFPDLFLGLSTRNLSLPRIFLHNSFILFRLPCGPSVVVSQLECLIIIL